MKVFQWFFIFVLILLSFIWFSAHKAAAVAVDTLIKSSESTVYYYAADGKRYVFPNEKTYKSWFTSYNKVQLLNQEELAVIPLAANVTYRPGIRMVKIQTDPKVYAVSHGGLLRWVKTEELAQALYGSDWNKKIDDVSDAFFVNYKIGSPIEKVDDYSPHGEADFIKTINDDKNISKSSTPLLSDTTVTAPEAVSVLTISEIKVSEITAISARITWLTSAPAASVIEYGTQSLSLGSGEQVSSEELEIDHNFKLSNLKAGANYFFRVSSKDAKGNEAKSAETVFATLAAWESFRITNNSADDRRPVIAAASSQYAISWADNSNGQDEIYFGYLGSDGKLATGPFRMTENVYDSRVPAIAWNSGAKDAAVVWEDRNAIQREIYFRKIDSDGNMPISETRITNKAGHAKNPKVAWDGTNFGVAWWDSRAYGEQNYNKGSVYFVQYEKSGLEIGNETKISVNGASEFAPDLAWNGSEYAAVFFDDSLGEGEIYMVKIDSGGDKIGSDIKLTETIAASLNPSFAWNGENYGVVWQEKVEAGYYEIFYQKVSKTGAKIGEAKRLTNKLSGDSESPDIVWNGQNFGITWVDYRNSTSRAASEIYFLAIDSDGNIKEQEQNVSQLDGLSLEPQIAAVSGKFNIVWAEAQPGNFEIYSANKK